MAQLPFTISSKTTLNLKEVLRKEDKFHCSPRGSLTVHSRSAGVAVSQAGLDTQRLARLARPASHLHASPPAGLPSQLNKLIHDSPCPQIIHGLLEVPQGPGPG